MNSTALKGIAMGVLFVASLLVEQFLGLSPTDVVFGLPLGAAVIFSIGYWSGIVVEKAF